MFAHLFRFSLYTIGFILGFLLLMAFLAGTSSFAYYLQNILPFSGLTISGFFLSDIFIILSFLVAFVSLFLASYSRVVSDSRYSTMLVATALCCGVLSFIFAFFLFPLFSPIEIV